MLWAASPSSAKVVLSTLRPNRKPLLSVHSRRYAQAVPSSLNLLLYLIHVHMNNVRLMPAAREGLVARHCCSPL